MADETTTTIAEQTKVTVETDVPESFKPSLNKLQERSENLSRSSERGIVNEVFGASIVARDNGQVNVSANEYTQIKLNPDGRLIQQSIESVTMTNRKKITTDEIVINEHKLNPMLYELTDFKRVLDDSTSVVGNFCVMGTVLVKCWEPNLKRYVLIRRQVRMPMFSPLLNVPEIMPELGIGDPLKEVQDLQSTMASGYQVNGEITDAKSALNPTSTTSVNAQKVADVKDKATEAVKKEPASYDKVDPNAPKKPDPSLEKAAKTAQDVAAAAKADYNKAQEKFEKADNDVKTAQVKLAKCQTDDERKIQSQAVATYTTIRDAAAKERDGYYNKYRFAETAAKEADDKAKASAT